VFSLREKCLIVPTHRAGDAYRGTRVQGTRPTATSSRGDGVRLAGWDWERPGRAGDAWLRVLVSPRFRLVLLFFQELTLDLTKKKTPSKSCGFPESQRAAHLIDHERK
jgi:hypothetical protein